MQSKTTWTLPVWAAYSSAVLSLNSLATNITIIRLGLAENGSRKGTEMQAVPTLKLLNSDVKLPRQMQWEQTVKRWNFNGNPINSWALVLPIRKRSVCLSSQHNSV